MLAVRGRPFDSADHLYEIKWDGFRALLFVEAGRVRLVSRAGRDLAGRFPELAVLGELEDGLLLDGEIVVFRAERPDFHALLARQHPRRGGVPRAAADLPATYVAFDLLYRAGRNRMLQPLRERRGELREVLAGAVPPRLVLSEGMEGGGVAFYEEACRRDLEGAVAKHLDSPYQPGLRSGAWVKFKHRRSLLCLVIGYLPKGPRDFQSLLVAASVGADLRYVGRVGSGFTGPVRDELVAELQARPRRSPLVECEEKGRWIEPGLYALVSYAELTPHGLLRAAVFERRVRDPQDG